MFHVDRAGGAWFFGRDGVAALRPHARDGMCHSDLVDMDQ
jgi:hypothetical protein